MDWLAALGWTRAPSLLGILWMLPPAVLVGQALRGLWRRMRLLHRALPVVAEVYEIESASETDAIAESTMVDLLVRYRVGDREYGHRLTRIDHRRVQYRAGGKVSLLHERGNPGNVIDADRHPWNDVIGPLVLGALLFVFMGWLLLFVGGLR